MQSPSPIAIEARGAAVWLTLDRAEKLNPLDWATVKALRAAVDAIEADAVVRSVVITGRGRSFSAGGDLDGYVRLYRDPPSFQGFLDDFLALLEAIEASAKIYVAAINGVCVAGGLEVLLACDVVIAAETARIGDGHLNFGQLPGAGGSQRLPRAVGSIRAKHLVLSGELLSAAEAERIGLVTQVVPAVELEARVTAYLDAMHEKSPAGLRGAKHLINLAARTDLADGLRQEVAYVHRYATTEPDATEGLIAFHERRAPRFGGRANGGD